MKTQVILLSTALFFAQPFQFNTAVKEQSTDQSSIAASTNAGFSYLRTHRQGKGISATWAMTSTEGVTDFNIQKTYEDPNDPYAFWEDMDIVPCDFSRSFKYNDNNVFPGTVNYRVVAHLNNGAAVVSEISVVKIMKRG